jgi:hypothetical protein
MILKEFSIKKKNSLISILDMILFVGLLIFLVVLPFHLVVKKLLPDPVGTYWKEILLGFLVVLLIIRFILNRQSILLRNQLEGAVFFYAGLIVLRLIVDRSGLVGWWGLYVSIMYLPLFWLVPAVLKPRPAWVMKLLILLTGIGVVLAIGGLLEFVINKPLWPSSEILQRQGFADVFIYGTHLRRVYFILDSPTTLANTLAILLPLALVLAIITESRWGRYIAGVASILLIACIVVTFSRGIWVASTVALIYIGLQAGLIQKLKRTLLVAFGMLLVGGLVWGSVVLLRSKMDSPDDGNVVELPSQVYQTMSVTHLNTELIKTEPNYGEFASQTWTLYDPIERRDDTRIVLYEHPTETEKMEIIYQVQVPQDGAIRFAIALSPDVWSPEKGDGATFSVFVVQPDNPADGEIIFVRYINPKSNPNDRRWRNFLVDLSPWAGSTINLSLITEAGPAGNWAYDWAGWSDLQVVSVSHEFFVSSQKENAVLDHTGSILDWVQDETNRDRLAAWSLSFSAWRTNPLWGTGLGSTGVAALRTKPESAFVTESQILKALTELGLPGLLVLGYLWFQIGRVGYLAYQSETDSKKRLVLLGITTSLLVVFIDGMVYQNLEVKQVNAYFWTLVGVLSFLSWRMDE